MIALLFHQQHGILFFLNPLIKVPTNNWQASNRRGADIPIVEKQRYISITNRNIVFAARCTYTYYLCCYEVVNAIPESV